MCNRHIAHIIADYEAARLGEEEEGTDGTESRDAEQRAHAGLLTTLRNRFAR